MSKQNKAKKQHFIPQYYLNKFNSQKVYRGKKRDKPQYDYYVWMYDKKTKQKREVDVKCVGKEENCYDIPKTLLLSLLKENPEITAPAYLENNLWKDEDYNSSIFLNTILRKIEKNQTDNEGQTQINNIIENTDKDGLLRLMISQLFRTPKFRNNLINISNHIAQIPQVWSTGEKKTNDLIKQILEIIQENPQYLHASNYICNPNRREELYCALKERAFFIGINTTNKPLLTSDSPIVFDNGKDGFNRIQLRGEGLELSFPLSPKFIVITIDKKIPDLMDENIKGILLDLGCVTNFNNLQILQSNSQVYSKENFDWLHDGV